jgi:hypothetical protein
VLQDGEASAAFIERVREMYRSISARARRQ